MPLFANASCSENDQSFTCMMSKLMEKKGNIVLIIALCSQVDLLSSDTLAISPMCLLLLLPTYYTLLITMCTIFLISTVPFVVLTLRAKGFSTNNHEAVEMHAANTTNVSSYPENFRIPLNLPSKMVSFSAANLRDAPSCNRSCTEDDRGLLLKNFVLFLPPAKINSTFLNLEQQNYSCSVRSMQHEQESHLMDHFLGKHLALKASLLSSPATSAYILDTVRVWEALQLPPTSSDFGPLFASAGSKQIILCMPAGSVSRFMGRFVSME